MHLEMPQALGADYKNASQKARVISEAWGEENLYCANCSSHRLARLSPNTPTIDFRCPDCDSSYQLKGQAHCFSTRISDAAYSKMHDAVTKGRAPNLLALHYDPALWSVRNLILIPRFVFSSSCIERRRPLRDSARRHGAVLCNILLTSIPPDARISLVSDGAVAACEQVRELYARLRPLAKLSHSARGWTLDVLNVVRALNKTEFTLQEVYAFASHLQKLHPANRFVHPKIRQQLQELRRLGLVEFLGGGRYRCG